MPKINIEPTPASTTPKVLVPNDTWDAVIKNVGDIRDVPKWEKPEETEEKITLEVEITMGEGKTAILPMFVTAAITKGSGDYSNSKLYNLLEGAGQLEVVKKLAEEMSKMKEEPAKKELFSSFVRNALQGKKCRATTKVVNKGKKEEYSRISEIARFL